MPCSVLRAIVLSTTVLVLAAEGRTAPAAQEATSAERGWPAISAQTKPWTRWWWHGSAVDRRNLTLELEALRNVGIGGVEITPIYGVRGEESRFISYLSETWVAMLAHTLREAERLGLGVDMATGTGWPFGGPWVGDDHAPRTLAHRTWTVEAGATLGEPIRFRQPPLVRALGNQIYEVGEVKPGEPPPVGSTQQPRTRRDVRPLQIEDLAAPLAANRNLQALAIEQIKYPRTLTPFAVVAYGESGRVTDVSAQLDANGVLKWTAPERSNVYALFAGAHGKLVERAAPGGEGNVIDHFSRPAIRSYLARFDRALGQRTIGLRAFFNDSYEVDDATGQGNWTPRLLDEFERRRGYDLRRHLPALLAGEGDHALRVLADYRETVSDLLLETFTAEWGAWARRRGAVVRNQAHGSPANLLDLYAASEIPETEGTEIPRFKWAVSAANVAGRRLVSAEAATWLGEHFRSTLADVRAAVDHFFAAGVNHIVYHGTAYSPDDQPWPGWQFYAAVDFNRRSAWWDDFATLNAYVTRTQAFLQSGRADHDVLLYFPFHDAVATRGNALLTHFGGASRPTAAAGFEATAATLQSRGYTYDYLSDRQLRTVRWEDGRFLTEGGGSYRTLVVPACRLMPLDTLEHVVELAWRGAPVIVTGDGPADVAGLASLETRQPRFQRARGALEALAASARASGMRTRGPAVVWGDDLESALTGIGVARERLVDQGLLFARRRDAHGRFYFVSNRTDRVIDGWIPFETGAPGALVFEAMSGRYGNALVRRAGPNSLEAYLQIPPGESLILATAARPAGDDYAFYRPAGAAVPLGAPWTIRFLKGGPALPDARTVERLVSWTELDTDDRLVTFSGTAVYSTTFAAPPGAAEAWQLDLGRVHESARVRLNGRDLGTFIGPAFRLVLESASLRDTNVLDVTVTNLSANRIADLDRRGAPWKKFYNVNMPSRLPQNRGPDGLFTAAAWEPLPSGLLGPVTLTPIARVR